MNIKRERREREIFFSFRGSLPKSFALFLDNSVDKSHISPTVVPFFCEVCGVDVIMGVERDDLFVNLARL